MSEIISQFWIYVSRVGSLVILIMSLYGAFNKLLNLRTKIKWLKNKKCPRNKNHPENKNRELSLFSTIKISDEKIIEKYICKACYNNPYKKYYYYQCNEKTPKGNVDEKYIWRIKWLILKIMFRKNIQ